MTPPRPGSAAPGVGVAVSGCGLVLGLLARPASLGLVLGAGWRLQLRLGGVAALLGVACSRHMDPGHSGLQDRDTPSSLAAAATFVGNK